MAEDRCILKAVEAHTYTTTHNTHTHTHINKYQQHNHLSAPSPWQDSFIKHIQTRATILPKDSFSIYWLSHGNGVNYGLSIWPISDAPQTGNIFAMTNTQRPPPDNSHFLEAMCGGGVWGGGGEEAPPSRWWRSHPVLYNKTLREEQWEHGCS